MGAGASQRGNALIRRNLEDEKKAYSYSEAEMFYMRAECERYRRALDISQAKEAKQASELERAKALIERLRAERNALRDELDFKYKLIAHHKRVAAKGEEHALLWRTKFNCIDAAMRTVLTPKQYLEAVNAEKARQ